ncbi:MAG: LPS export ABC transporter periplasmic protein LptC [Acidobacteriota bacterium]|nr:LPS export ABC transporter periplasmic protein LptC [Acidobacteriota bacterium]
MRNRDAARYARWSAMAAGLIVLVVIGAYAYRAALRARARRHMPAPVPASVERKSAEFTYKSVDQGRTLFTLRASEVTQFKDHGRALLQDVWITIYGRDGNQNDNIHTRECSFDPQSGGARCRGSVQIEIQSAEPAAAVGAGSSALALQTSDLTFDRGTGDASTSAPVQFTFPGGSGSGVGVDYSTRKATVRVERAIRFQLAASDKTGGLPVTATGSSLEIHRDARTAVLNGPVDVREGQRALSARQIAVEFDATNHARRVLVNGQPEIRANENGSAIALSASQFEAALNPAGWIERIVANGNVRAARQADRTTSRFSAGRVEFAMIPQRNLVQTMMATQGVEAQARQGAQSDTLRTAALQIAFAPAVDTSKSAAKAAPNEIAHQRIESAETLAPATMELTKGGETTTLTAQKLAAEVGRNGAIEKLFAHSGVTIRRQTTAGVPLTISAPELAVTVGSRGQWRAADATGGVRMQQGDQQATANSARIDRATNAIRLEGSPSIIDRESRTTAQGMAFNQQSGVLEASGGVISTYLPSADQQAVSLGAGPAHISADALTGSATSGQITYSGHVRLWQGQSILEADRIDVWRDLKKMQASGNVVAVFPQSAAGPSIPKFPRPVNKPADGSDPARWKIRAPLLTYWAGEGRARLEDGVVADSSQGTLHSQTLDVYFGQPVNPSGEPAGGQPETLAKTRGTRQLERAIAQGGVVIEQGDRKGMAQRAEYTASDGKFVLSGGEPTITDGSSNTATGTSLTFYVASDTILIDSQEGSRTLTRHKVEK